jgi:hypothetical protein
VLLIATVTVLPTLDNDTIISKREKLPTLGLTQIRRDNVTELLIEQISAYNPAPLFIPSEMNSNAPELPPGIRPGELGPFTDIQSQYIRSSPLEFPERVKTPSSPVEGLRRTKLSDTWLVIGRADGAFKNDELRAARVEVVKLGSSKIALELVVPTPELLAAGDWQPFEFMGAVTREGLAGDLVVTATSGSSEIDDNFRSLLRKNVLIGDRLSVGFYTFRIGQ